MRLAMFRHSPGTSVVRREPQTKVPERPSGRVTTPWGPSWSKVKSSLTSPFGVGVAETIFVSDPGWGAISTADQNGATGLTPASPVWKKYCGLALHA